MTESTGLDPQLRNRLTRYLHTGNEVPKYYPGCWSSHKYFESDRLPVLNEIFSTHTDNLEVIEIILKAYKDGWYTRFETIAFTLTKCLHIGSPLVKEATYKAAASICNTPEEMMMFNKYTRTLKTGNGKGWCKNVHMFYTKKDAMELAKEMTRVRARHGRSHKTLLRKSHIKIAANDRRRDAVVKYAIYGLKRAKQIVGEDETTKDIFDYIQKVEDMRHCEDPAAAALLATCNKFTLDHVPGHLLTSQCVWQAVLPQLTLEQLLFNIQRVHNMGFLRNDSPTVQLIVSLLGNEKIINKSKVTPIGVYITMCDYKKKSKPLKAEKARIALDKEKRRRSRQMFDPKTGIWEWTVTRRHPKEVKNWGIEHPPNEAILMALNKLMDSTWSLGKPTNVRYMITMDMRHHMFKGRHFCKKYDVVKKNKKTTVTKPAPSGGGDGETEKPSKKRLLAECFYNKHVTPGHAAIILALQLLKREKHVKLAVFTEESVKIVDLERNFTNIEEAEFVMRKLTLGRVQLDAPMEWASSNNEKVDVFINMLDRTTRFMELDLTARGGRGPGGRYGPPPPPENEVPDHCPVRALERYRASSGVKDAKLIVMSLASHRIATTDGSHEGVLDIVGIDEEVPKVIDAFALGQFK